MAVDDKNEGLQRDPLGYDSGGGSAFGFWFNLVFALLGAVGAVVLMVTGSWWGAAIFVYVIAVRFGLRAWREFRRWKSPDREA